MHTGISPHRHQAKILKCPHKQNEKTSTKLYSKHHFILFNRYIKIPNMR